MNADRRAGLQRKLAIAQVPKPPDGLAERIKSEIPKELRLRSDPARERMTRSIRLSLAIAASVVVVVTTAFLALQITSGRMEPESKEAAVSTAPPPILRSVPPPEPAAPPPLETEVAAPKPKTRSEVRVAARAQKKEEKTVVSNEPAVMDQAAKDVAAAAPAAAAPAVPPQANAVAERVVAQGAVAKTAAPAKLHLDPAVWRDASPDKKIEMLKKELARGADPKEVIRAAREAGLDEFADSVEKKKP